MTDTTGRRRISRETRRHSWGSGYIPFTRSRTLTCALLASLLTLTSLLGTHSAAASTSQYAMIEDDTALHANPVATLRKMQALGAQVVRVFIPWRDIAPAVEASSPPAGFNGIDARAYPQQNFALYDQIVTVATSLGMKVDLVVTGPVPKWAEGTGVLDANPAWEPIPGYYAQFFTAVASRYSGGFVPNFTHTRLPRVSYWEIWNEPNFGEDLGPQALHDTPVAERSYRALLNAGWDALHATGHGHDTIVIGQLAARGTSGPPNANAPEGYPGIDGQTKPLIFIRSLYCLDNGYKPLHGVLAAVQGCPTDPRQFRAQNPALFYASGFGIHPYPQGQPPTKDSSRDPDFVPFNGIPRMESVLDLATAAYGSQTQFPIYNNEYGYITDPPNRSGQFASPAVAAAYLNWAEYLSWRSPRVATTMQYLLYDPNPYQAPEFGGFASGLINSPFVAHGAPKAGYYAYRMPVFMPSSSTRRHRRLEVWGAARPAPAAATTTHRTQYVQIQFARGHARRFHTIARFADHDSHGYFDRHITFPVSGTLRVAYPDPLLHQTIYSRAIAVSVH